MNATIEANETIETDAADEAVQSVLNEAHDDAAWETLEENVILVAPTLKWWKGMYQLPSGKVETTLDGDVLRSADITSPRIKLMTDSYPLKKDGTPWKKVFQSLDSELSSVKQKYSVSFSLNGVRMVPRKHARTFMRALYGDTVGSLRHELAAGTTYVRERVIREQLERLGVSPVGRNDADRLVPTLSGEDSLAYRLQEAADAFAADLDSVRQQMAANNHGFAFVSKRVPSSEQVMRKKFGLFVTPIELKGSTRQEHKVTRDDLREYEDVVRNACRERVTEAVEQLIAEPRQELAAALESLQELIARDGSVTSKSFNPVRAAISKIRLFDFVADDTLLSQIASLEEQLDITVPKTLTSETAAASGFSAAMQSFRDGIEAGLADAQSYRSVGKAARVLDLD